MAKWTVSLLKLALVIGIVNVLIFPEFSTASPTRKFRNVSAEVQTETTDENESQSIPTTATATITTNTAKKLRQVIPPGEEHLFNGKCKKGKVYKITEMKQLYNYLGEEECIFHAAHEPNKVPIGPTIGITLSLGDTQKFNFISDGIWTGKFTTEMICNGSKVLWGWNRIGGDAQFPYEGSLGFYADKVNNHPGEYMDDKVSFILDYIKDSRKVCPDYEEVVKRNGRNMAVTKAPWNIKMMPSSQVIDVVRVAGRQEDGGAIFVGKVYYRDVFLKEVPFRVIAYFAMLSYDPEVLPELKTGVALPPLEDSFRFRQATFMDFITDIMPGPGDFVADPKTFTRRLLTHGVTSARNTFNFWIDYFWNLDSADTKKFTRIFELASQQMKKSKAPDSDEELETNMIHDSDFHPHTVEL